MPKIVVYESSGGIKSAVVKKIASACGFPYKTSKDFLHRGIEGDIVICAGILGVGGAVIQEAQRLGKTFIYLDYGYFNDSRKGRWWRVHVNSFHAKTWYDFSKGPKRAWRKYDRIALKPVHPYTKKGNHILVCPPTPAVSEYFGQQDWLDKTLNELKNHTNKPIKVRYKPSVVGVYWQDGMLFNSGETIKTPADTIDNDFTNCWAMVTYNSAMFVDALRRGVPVFSGDACAAHLLENTDLAGIEHPAYKNHMALFWSLAEQQFTVSEMMQPETWKYVLLQAGITL
jgi:hypothetical protein